MHHMDDASKKALANAYKAIVALRKSSYDRALMTYTMGHHDAAKELVRRGVMDEATANLAAPMAASGYCDFGDWADSV